MKPKLVFLALLLPIFAVSQANYHFKNIDVSEGLPSSQVYQSVQDAEGYMWFATDGGVCKYDGYRITTYTTKEGLTDNVVFGFFYEKKKRLWFYTYTGGVCYYEKGRIYEPCFNDDLKEALKSFERSIIINMAVDDEGIIWLGIEGEKILKVTPKGDIIKLGKTEGVKETILLKPMVEGKPFPIYNGCVLESPEKGLRLIHFDEDLDSLFVDLSGVKAEKRLMGRSKVMLLDNESFIYAYSNQLAEIWREKTVKKHYLNKGQRVLFALMLDSENAFWVGTVRGVLRFPDADINKKPDVFLAEVEVSSVFQDKEGGLWFTSLNRGVFYLPHFQIESIPGKAKPRDLISNKDGVYVGCSNSDLEVFLDGDITNTLHFPKLWKESRGFSHWKGKVNFYNLDLIPQEVQNLKVSRTEGMRVFGFRRHFRNDDQSRIFWNQSAEKLKVADEQTYQVLYTGDLNIHETRIKSFSTKASSDTAWVGSTRGLNLLIKSTNLLQELKHKYPQFSAPISDLDLLNDSMLLVTTQQENIFRYDFKNDEVKTLIFQPGVTFRHSYVDTCGTVWVASFSGVMVIDNPTEDSPKSNIITSSNGLSSNQVYRLAQYKDKIWAATREGLNRWDITWRADSENPKAEVTSIRVNGAQVDSVEAFNLNHNQNHLQFYFNTISFQKPVEYKYRLKGLHSNWLRTKEREAQYMALKPGNYTFELKHVGEEDVSFVPIIIKQPIWLRTWFITLCLGVVVLIVYIVLRLRFKTIKKENKLFELFHRAEEKALRAQVNPHFLFNAFNSVIELVVAKKYQNVQVYLGKLATIMRLVLRFSRYREVSLREEREFLQLYLDLEKLRYDQSFSTHIEVAEDLDENEIVIPSLFLQIYVENAVKHGLNSRKDNKGRVEISFSRKENLLVVKIADNGKGYLPSKNKKGKPSYGMKINGERIQKFGDSSHKVSILAFNENNKSFPGTVVNIELPIKTLSHETQNSNH